jgi:lipopolysaccharide/colanic/teichoic acid biosynthesis glycosyltransferase
VFSKRIFDILSSTCAIFILAPFFVIIAFLIRLDSKGPIIYRQKRVGKGNKDFYLNKFRTMVTDADKKGQLTVGMRDSRITKIGYFLRKYKLDEFPQLINVLNGEMSIVGPRPEVRKYVELYNEKQLHVLAALPGLTDTASLTYINENEILGKAENPEKTYIEEVMPAKLELNLQYIDKQNLKTDIDLIFQTLKKIVK